MHISEKPLHVRAVCKIQHHRAYDYDEKQGLWLRELVFEEEVPNEVTDVGRVTVHTYIYGTAAQRGALSGTGLNYIGLSNDGTAPAAGDTTLIGELVADGLQRVQGTVVLPVGAATLSTVSNLFTYSGGGTQQVQKTALFDTDPAGLMAHEILFTQRTLATSDTITITFNVTLS